MRLLNLIANVWARLNGLLYDYTLQPEGVKVYVVKKLWPKWAAAQTIGESIVMHVNFDGHAQIFNHEMIHVKQFRQYGLLLPLLYAFDCIVKFAQGKHYYFDNRFEVEAREVSGW